jgi:hypothetical protein
MSEILVGRMVAAYDDPRQAPLLTMQEPRVWSRVDLPSQEGFNALAVACRPGLWRRSSCPALWTPGRSPTGWRCIAHQPPGWRSCERFLGCPPTRRRQLWLPWCARGSFAAIQAFGFRAAATFNIALSRRWAINCPAQIPNRLRSRRDRPMQSPGMVNEFHKPQGWRVSHKPIRTLRHQKGMVATQRRKEGRLTPPRRHLSRRL